VLNQAVMPRPRWWVAVGVVCAGGALAGCTSDSCMDPQPVPPCQPSPQVAQGAGGAGGSNAGPTLGIGGTAVTSTADASNHSTGAGGGAGTASPPVGPDAGSSPRDQADAALGADGLGPPGAIEMADGEPADGPLRPDHDETSSATNDGPDNGPDAEDGRIDTGDAGVLAPDGGW
jgi:hypothetical protein